MNADQVRALVAAKFPGVLDGPLATACRAFEAADTADREVQFAKMQARAAEIATGEELSETCSECNEKASGTR